MLHLIVLETKGRWMRFKRTLARTSVVLPACAAAATLLAQTGVASAASRGYDVHNKSHHTLRLEKAEHVPTVLCNASICVPTSHPMEFEGRPANGSQIKPSASQRWELKYGFGYTYAAVLKYKVEGTDATFEATIETSTFSNNSACKVVPASAGSCTAGGTSITFK
jgi:hypothetical protein